MGQITRSIERISRRLCI